MVDGEMGTAMEGNFMRRHDMTLRSYEFVHICFGLCMRVLRAGVGTRLLRCLNEAGRMKVRKYFGIFVIVLAKSGIATVKIS